MKRLAALCLALAIAPGLTGQARAADPAPAATPVTVRHALESMLPPGVRIKDVQLTGQIAKVSGMSGSAQQISDFMRRIAASTVFGGVNLQTIEKSGSGDSTFTLTTDVHCPKAGEQVANNPCGASSPAAAASVYKCTVNGASTFQSTPCTTGAKR